MKEHEPPNEYFARGSVWRRRLAQHGVTLSDVDAYQQFARTFPVFLECERAFFLSNAELTCNVLEDVVLSAYGFGEGERGGEEDRDGWDTCYD